MIILSTDVHSVGGGSGNSVQDSAIFVESIANASNFGDGVPTVVVIMSTTAITPTVALSSGTPLLLDGGNSNESGTSNVNNSWWPVVVPDWSTARLELKWIWLVHTYGFACLFFMLAFYSFFSVLNLRAQLSTRPYMSSINVFLCLLGISRAICFLIDPYDSKGIMPETIGSILWALAFPCLISAFGLIQLAFLQLTQLKLGPSKLRSKSCMSLVITTHFCLTIASNILWTFQKDFKVLGYVYQTVFVCWGAVICIVFLYGGWQMIKLLKHAPPSMFHRSDSSGFENKAAMTAAAAAAVPSFMATPKIRITDENEQTYSYVSDNSHLSSSQNLHVIDTGQDHLIVDGCQPSPRRKTGTGSGASSNPGVYTLSEDGGPNLSDEVGSASDSTERAKMLQQSSDGGRHRESGKVGPGGLNTKSNSGPKSGAEKKGGGLLGVMRANGALKLNGRNTNTGNGGREGAGSGKGCKKKGDSLEMSLLPQSSANRGTTSNGGRGGGRGGSGAMEVKHDLTLMSILNHIAYVNQAADDYKFDARKLKPTRKNQIEKVLHGTYASAILGLSLCVLEAYRIYGIYGIAAGAQPPSPWPWFIFQSICRIVEFSMGCFMANITKQPVNRHHYPYSCHMKHRGGGLYF